MTIRQQIWVCVNDRCVCYWTRFESALLTALSAAGAERLCDAMRTAYVMTSYDWQTLVTSHWPKGGWVIDLDSRNRIPVIYIIRILHLAFLLGMTSPSCVQFRITNVYNATSEWPSDSIMIIDVGLFAVVRSYKCSYSSCRCDYKYKTHTTRGSHCYKIEH
jgi:hypothetical protein